MEDRQGSPELTQNIARLKLRWDTLNIKIWDTCNARHFGRYIL